MHIHPLRCFSCPTCLLARLQGHRRILHCSLQLSIGHDRSGEQTAELLSRVFGRLAVDLTWRPQLAELLNGLDEVSCSL